MTATAEFANPRRCRVCGCTDDKACMTDAGPCHWIEPDLCSACEGKDPRHANRP